MSYIGAKNALRVPSGYTQLEYIQSTGTQYINTGFVPNQDTRLIIDIETTKTNTAAIFGARQGNTDATFTVFNVSATEVRTDYGTVQNSLSVGSILNRVIIDKNKNVFSYGGNTITQTASTFNCGCSLLLLTNNYQGSAVGESLTSAKVYSCKIYDNGVLVRDFVPCKNPSGTVGMYDVVNGVFYGNAGTGTFTAGAEIPNGFVARVTPNWYFGDSNNMARNIVAGYIGDANNLARLFYSASNLFGDGSDGDAVISAATTLLAATEDTGMIVKNYKSLTITSAGSLTAGNRNCGMIIRVKGDCTIDGSIVNMMAPKTILDSDGVDFSIYPATMKTTLAGAGGNGGGTNNNRGYGMSGRFYGGGYSGGAAGGYNGTRDGGRGGNATDITTEITNIFVGGAAGQAGTYGGGGGGRTYKTSAPGGTGGNGPGGKGGGGTGAGSNGGGAGNYGGGVVILLVGGNLTISSTGKINCNGGNGGASGRGGISWSSFGGGGGGGGRIFICHKGTIANNGSLTVNGGSIGATTPGTGEAYHTEGTAGGIGTIAIKTYDQYMEEDVA